MACSLTGRPPRAPHYISALTAAAVQADLGSPSELRLSISANPWISTVLLKNLTQS